MMSSKMTPLLLLLLGALSLTRAQAADGLVMNTPTTLSTCQNASLSWDHAAAGKIYITIVPGGKPNEKALVKFDEMDANAKSLPWLVDLPAGTSVTVMATDSTGATTGSAAVTIQEGVDTSCVGHGQSGKQPGSSSSSSNNNNEWTKSGQWTSAGIDPKAGTSPSSSADNNSTTKTTSAANAAPADKASTSSSPLKDASNSTSHNATPVDTNTASKIDNKTDSSSHKDDNKKQGSLTLSAAVSSASSIFILNQENILLSTGALLTTSLLFGILQ